MHAAPKQTKELDDGQSILRLPAHSYYSSPPASPPAAPHPAIRLLLQQLSNTQTNKAYSRRRCCSGGGQLDAPTSATDAEPNVDQLPVASTSALLAWPKSLHDQFPNRCRCISVTLLYLSIAPRRHAGAGSFVSTVVGPASSGWLLALCPVRDPSLPRRNRAPSTTNRH